MYGVIFYGMVNKITIYKWDEWEGHAVKLVPPPTTQSRLHEATTCYSKLIILTMFIDKISICIYILLGILGI